MALSAFGWALTTTSEIARVANTAAESAVDKAIGLLRPIRGWGSSAVKTQEVLFQTALLAELYDYAFYSDTYRTIVNTITRELFRKARSGTRNSKASADHARRNTSRR